MGAASQLKNLYNQILGGTAPSGSASAAGDISQMVKYLVTVADAGRVPMPPVVGTQSWHCIGTALAADAKTAAASATWPTANLAIFVPVMVTETITVTKLWIYNGATASGNVNMALYDSDFIQVANSEIGSTAQSGTNVLQEFDITDVELGPGLYYIAAVLDNTTGTVFRHTGSDFARSVGLFSEASAFNLPGTATPADASTVIPIIGMATRLQVA